MGYVTLGELLNSSEPQFMIYSIHFMEKLGIILVIILRIILVKGRAQNQTHFEASIISISGKQSDSIYVVFSDSSHYCFYIQFY